MHFLKVPEKKAEKLKQVLAKKMLLDKQGSIKHSPSYVYFPVVVSSSYIKKLAMEHDATLVSGKDTASHKKGSSKLDIGYDILGNIAIVDVPKGKPKKEKQVAESLMKLHPKVTTVVAKASAIKGKFRTRKFRFIGGKRNFIATYKENGCIFKFDIRKSFFSNRLSFERSRIVSLVKGRENVLVLFAGVGPYAIEIAKAHPKTKVVALELNKSACAEMRRNIQLNKTENVTVVNADAGKLPQKLKSFADRIIVPMPSASVEFLDSIYFAAKRKCIVHLYAFAPSENAADKIYSEISEWAHEDRYKTKLLFSRNASTYSAKDVEVVIDYLLKKSYS